MPVERGKLPQAGKQAGGGALPQADERAAAHEQYGAVFDAPRLFSGT